MSKSNEGTNETNTVAEAKPPFTSTIKGYIAEHVLFAMVLGYDLIHFLPKFIRIAWFDKSVVSLVVCLLISCVVGIVLTRNNRHWQYVCLDVLAGLGIYAAWTFVNYLSPGRFRLMLVIAVCVAIAGMALSVLIPKKCQSDEKDSAKDSPAAASSGIRGISIAWLGVTMAAITVCVFLPISVKCTDDAEIKSTYYEKVGYDGVTGDTYEPTYVYGDEYSEENNMESIKNVDDSIWPTLSDADKEETLRTIAYAYANDQGIGVELELIFSDDSNEDGYGKYVYAPDKSQIYISTECLSDSETAIQAVIHQVYHVYQCEECDIYVTLTDTQRALWQFHDCDTYIRYLNGDPLLGYEDELDAGKFESYAKYEGEFQATNYIRSAYDYLHPDQED